MAGPWTLGLLCGLLAAALAEATLSSPAVLSLGPEVIKERKFESPQASSPGKGQVNSPTKRRKFPTTGVHEVWLDLKTFGGQEN